MSVRDRVVLGTLAFCNALIVSVLALLAFVYVTGTSGRVIGVLLAIGAGVLFVLAHSLRQDDEWNWPE